MQKYGLNAGRYGAFEGNGTFFKTPHKIAAEGNKVPIYPGKEGFAMAELPYKGEELSMLLIAPLAHDGLASIEKQVTSARLTAWLAKLEKREVHVKVPKFRLETDYSLHKHLPEMGMAQAFTNPVEPNGADFTGIHNTEVLAQRLYITAVIHKAYLDVNEEGTEAAAATAIPVSPAEAPHQRREMVPFTPTFKADRPFLLLIRHNATGTILFMGRVANPIGEQASEF